MNIDPEQFSGVPPVRCGVVAVIRDCERLLVIRRSQTVLAPGAYCFPGGGIEPGETEEQALCRELQEELDVAIEPVRRIWQCRTAWNVDLRWWTARLLPGAMIRPNPQEVESVHWLRLGEIAALPELLAGNQIFLDGVAAGAIRLD
ncbi:MAG: NUDIX domain-containing protein [Planctomycetota bacterium]|nr:NUDIX domain-containing protein [Planctomycetota bacterium]